MHTQQCAHKCTSAVGVKPAPYCRVCIATYKSSQHTHCASSCSMRSKGLTKEGAVVLRGTPNCSTACRQICMLCANSCESSDADMHPSAQLQLMYKRTCCMCFVMFGCGQILLTTHLLSGWLFVMTDEVEARTCCNRRGANHHAVKLTTFGMTVMSESIVWPNAAQRAESDAVRCRQTVNMYTCSKGSRCPYFWLVVLKLGLWQWLHSSRSACVMLVAASAERCPEVSDKVFA